VPDAQVCLFSPQTYFIECEQGKLVITKDETTLEVNDGSLLSFPINKWNNLPFALMDDKQRHSMLQFDNMHEDHILLNVAAETNQNISGPQRELLFWHRIMGHSEFQWVQRLMKPKRPRYRNHFDDTNVARPVIITERLEPVGLLFVRPVRLPEESDIRSAQPADKIAMMPWPFDAKTWLQVTVRHWTNTSLASLDVYRTQKEKNERNSGMLEVVLSPWITAPLLSLLGTKPRYVPGTLWNRRKLSKGGQTKQGEST
jgi:hypothetical protein